jgi:LPS-assembly lipoprotein
MWWLELRGRSKRRSGPRSWAAAAGRAAVVAATAAVLGGCFQPLYGDKTVGGQSSLHAQLAQVEVAQIPASNGTPESRIAVELRNNLVFGMTGGAGGAPPTHQLRIRISSTRLSVIVDIQSSRPDVENFGLNASYQLIDMKTGKPVLSDTTFARVSYDIPGQEQRFARSRALRDSENRAAKVIADAIQARLASYFVAKT